MPKRRMLHIAFTKICFLYQLYNVCVGPRSFSCPDKKIERRTRDYYSLHFIIGGKGTLVYEVNGQRQEVVLQKGDSFLLFAGEKYEYHPDPERPWGYDWIDFTGDNADDLFFTCGYDKERPFVHSRHFDRFRALLGDMIEAYDASEFAVPGIFCYLSVISSRICCGR